MGDHLTTVGEPDCARRRPNVEPDHVAGGQDLRAELVRLSARPVGELRTGHSIGESQIVLDTRALARLSAGRLPLDQHGAQTFRCGVHRRAEPRGPATDDHDVVEVRGRDGRQSYLLCQLTHARLDQVVALGGHHQRDAGHLDARGGEQTLALGLVGREPAVGHGVAGEEIPHLERPGRPAVADDLDPVHGLLVRGEPHLEKRVDDRVELLLRGIPGLQQIVIEVDDVDRLDGGVGVRIRGEQRPPRVREQIHRLLEELEAGHLRHAMVREQHRDRIATQLQLAQRLQRLGARLRPYHAVDLAVLAAQIPSDGARHARVVVDGQQDRLPVRLGGHEALTVSPLSEPSDERVDELSRAVEEAAHRRGDHGRVVGSVTVERSDERDLLEGEDADGEALAERLRGGGLARRDLVRGGHGARSPDAFTAVEEDAPLAVVDDVDDSPDLTRRRWGAVRHRQVDALHPESAQLPVDLAGVRAGPQVDHGRHPALGERAEARRTRLRSPPESFVDDVELANPFQFGPGVELRVGSRPPARGDQRQVALEQRADRRREHHQRGDAETTRPPGTRPRLRLDGWTLVSRDRHQVRMGTRESIFGASE